MKKREISRAEICLQIDQKKIAQMQAARDLGLSLKQMQRTYGKFVPTETTAGYMTTLREYIEKYGRPLAMGCVPQSGFGKH